MIYDLRFTIYDVDIRCATYDVRRTMNDLRLRDSGFAKYDIRVAGIGGFNECFVKI